MLIDILLVLAGATAGTFGVRKFWPKLLIEVQEKIVELPQTIEVEVEKIIEITKYQTAKYMWLYLIGMILLGIIIGWLVLGKGEKEEPIKFDGGEEWER